MTYLLFEINHWRDRSRSRENKIVLKWSRRAIMGLENDGGRVRWGQESAGWENILKTEPRRLPDKTGFHSIQDLP